MAHYTDWIIPVPFDVWVEDASGDYFTVLTVNDDRVTVTMGDSIGDELVLQLSHFGRWYSLFSSPTKGIAPRRRPSG